MGQPIPMDERMSDSAVLVWTGRTATVYGLAFVGVVCGLCGFISLYSAIAPSNDAVRQSQRYFGVLAGLGGVLSVAMCAWTIRWAVLQIRRAWVVLDERGMVRQDWRGRKQQIAWDAVESLAETHIEGGADLILSWVDDGGLLRRTLLIRGGSFFGTQPDYLRDLILRYKALPKHRQALTWYLSVCDIYETGP